MENIFKMYMIKANKVLKYQNREILDVEIQIEILKAMCLNPPLHTVTAILRHTHYFLYHVLWTLRLYFLLLCRLSKLPGKCNLNGSGNMGNLGSNKEIHPEASRFTHLQMLVMIAKFKSFK